MSKRTSAAATKELPTEDTLRPDESFGLLIREIYRGQARMLQTMIAGEGVSIGMWFVLRVLWEEDGISQRELARRVGINGPTTVTALNSMERAGLVRRTPHPSDRRKTNIFLTERGRHLKDRLWPMAVAVNQASSRGMSDEERRLLFDLLTRMQANLSADRP
jgi:MarR family transcriptional regulator, organic hydroperoxide resistance regulator